MLSRFYIAVQSKNFVLFEKECEWSKNISNMNNHNKLKKLQSIFLHTSETVYFELTDKIEDYEKEEYEADLIESSSNEEDNSSNDNENMDIEL